MHFHPGKPFIVLSPVSLSKRYSYLLSCLLWCLPRGWDATRALWASSCAASENVQSICCRLLVFTTALPGASMPILQMRKSRLRKVKEIFSPSFIYSLHRCLLSACQGCATRLCVGNKTGQGPMLMELTVMSLNPVLALHSSSLQQPCQGAIIVPNSQMRN